MTAATVDTPRLPWWAGRVALLIVSVTAAYWLSLSTLWRDLGGQTPLAFVGLAPALAVILLIRAFTRRRELPLPGTPDAVLGSLLIAAAAVIVIIGPGVASIYFWTARLDLVSIPLFAAGALVMLLGWRAIFAARGALTLLALAWPLPYLVIVENSSDTLTSITAGALELVVLAVPIARPAPGEAVFTVLNAAAPFQVQVAAACAGLNSTVAFLLVGGAFLLVLRGPMTRKLLWLVAGLAVVFAFNVLRVVLLVAVGAVLGESAALEVVHPLGGLLSLAAGVSVMLFLLPRFGLAPAGPALNDMASPLPEPRRRPHRAGMAGRAAFVALAAVVLGGVNTSFAAYESAAGGPTAAAVVRDPARSLGGWTVRSHREITIGKPYFGRDSQWLRYQLRPSASVSAEQRFSIWLDRVTVADRQRLVDFGPEKCYRFHGFTIDAVQPVALGSGVVASLASVAMGDGKPWLVLWWEWPVAVDGSIRHERVTLLANTQRVVDLSPHRPADRPLVILNLQSAVSAAQLPLAEELSRVGTAIVEAGLAGAAAS